MLLLVAWKRTEADAMIHASTKLGPVLKSDKTILYNEFENYPLKVTAASPKRPGNILFPLYLLWTACMDFLKIILGI